MRTKRKTISERIAELVDAAPPLTPEQLDEVVRVLSPAVKKNQGPGLPSRTLPLDPSGSNQNN